MTDETLKSIMMDNADILTHIGVLRRSGRYPWGSGKTPMQRNKDFLGYVEEMRKKGLSDKEIVDGLNLSSREAGFIKAKTEVLIPDEQVASIVDAIKTGMRPKNFLGLSTRETKREHLASLQERHNSATVCPKCGAELVLRTIKKGEKSGQNFYGCAKFPGCRFVRAIEGS